MYGADIPFLANIDDAAYAPSVLRLAEELQLDKLYSLVWEYIDTLLVKDVKSTGKDLNGTCGDA